VVPIVLDEIRVRTSILTLLKLAIWVSSNEVNWLSLWSTIRSLYK